jgi:urea ABC transporter substrate-binding protein
MLKLDRRQFIKTATGALVFVSTSGLLKKAGIAAEKPIRVGNILDKTGSLNIYSLNQIKAVAMAIDEINAAGGLLGRPLELFFYDSQSNNQLNSQYATQALVKDKVHVLHAGITSSSREVMRPIVRKYNGLFFYNSNYEGGACDRRYVCTALVPGQQMIPMVEYVVKELGGKRGYILAADYNYGHITGKWYQKLIRENGGEDIGLEHFPLDVNNFEPVISRLQTAKPDVIWLALVGSAHVAFYRQLHAAMGTKKPIMASTCFDSGMDQLQLSPDEAEGVIVSTAFDDDLPKKSARDWIAKFHKYVGNNDPVGTYGEMGYHGVYLWANAVKKAGKPDPDAVIKALDKTTFDGPGGLYTIDGKTNHTIMDVHIMRCNRQRKYDLIRSFPQRQPIDTQAVCDLFKHPNDTTQYEPKL